MTGFAVGAVCLVALALWLLRPAWRTVPSAAVARPAHLDLLAEQVADLERERDAGQIGAAEFQATQSELRRRALDDSATSSTAGILPPPGRRSMSIAVGLAVPIFAVALYALIGNPRSLVVQPAAGVEAAAAAGAGVTPEALETMLATMAQRLEQSPGSATDALTGWTLLGRSYATLQRFADADRAFVRALALAPGDAQLLADRADVLAMLQNGRITGEADRLVAESLRIDANNPKALALAGAAAYQRNDFTAARRYWQQARTLATAGSDFAAGLDRSLADQGGADAGAAAPGASASSAAAGAPVVAAAEPAAGTVARISGRVRLSPALAGQAAPGDTVFVFARAAAGPRMPLAVVRSTVAQLPLDFTLDDSLAMSPQMKLSAFERVVVGVRVSRSGSAMPQPGDLHGESAPTGTRATGLDIVVDQVQP